MNKGPSGSPAILFVCVHNACRSQIAEALCRRLVPATWAVESAGSSPSESVDPKAGAVLSRHGLKMPGLKPKGFEELGRTDWDYIVGMGCGGACPLRPAEKSITWDIPDPSGGPDALYEALFEDLSRRIKTLISEIGAKSGETLINYGEP